MTEQMWTVRGGHRTRGDRIAFHGRGRRAAAVVAVLVALPFALGGCDRGDAEIPPPPPPEVTIAQPIEREVSVDLEATGTVTGVETVEVRARVQGFISE